MTVREALEKIERDTDLYVSPESLTPIIERALRAEHTVGLALGYRLGSEGRYIGDLVMKHALMDYEPTAGVAAMVEEK